MLAGILKPSSGKITAHGRIGYVPQGTALLEDATVEENLNFFASLAKASVPRELPFSVESYKKKLVSTLSGGMKKQVSIACAAIGDPQIMLLDEPCAALDITFRDEMIRLVEKWKREGKTVIYVGHDPAEFYSFFNTLVFIAPTPLICKKEALQDTNKGLEEFTKFYKANLENLKRK